MKVILSTAAVRFPLTGIGRYNYELAKGICEVAPNCDLSFLYSGKLSRAISPPSLSEKISINAFNILKKNIQESPSTIFVRQAWISWNNYKALQSHSDAIFHSPNFYLPKFKGKKVVTIPDLSVFKWPECHPRGRAIVMQREIADSIKNADLIITISNYVRDEITSFFSIEKEKIIVTYLAASDKFRPTAINDHVNGLQKFGLQEKSYCFLCSTIEPRKNIDVALDAYSMLPVELRKRFPLVISGHYGWRSDLIHQRIAKAEGEGWAYYLGFVPDEELPLLYAGSRIFLFPSLYEGFGLPVLEAMASGAPVVCSNASSLPEIVDDAALTCEPEDVIALSQNIVRALSDDNWRRFASRRGMVLAQNFSWLRCARETLRAYELALKS